MNFVYVVLLVSVSVSLSLSLSLSLSVCIFLGYCRSEMLDILLSLALPLLGLCAPLYSNSTCRVSASASLPLPFVQSLRHAMLEDQLYELCDEEDEDEMLEELELSD